MQTPSRARAAAQGEADFGDTDLGKRIQALEATAAKLRQDLVAAQGEIARLKQAPPKAAAGEFILEVTVYTRVIEDVCDSEGGSSDLTVVTGVTFEPANKVRITEFPG